MFAHVSQKSNDHFHKDNEVRVHHVIHHPEGLDI